MATFQYRAKDNKGDVIEGTLEAENTSSVVSRLQSMGYFPIHIADKSEKKKRPWEQSVGRRPAVAMHKCVKLNVCCFSVSKVCQINPLRRQKTC